MRLAVRELAGPAAPPGAEVLLLHGLFGQARNLASLHRALSETHRVAAFDLRNHGASPHASGMDYPTMAADVADTLEKIGMTHPAVIGHSMGGKVAMRLALDHPDRVARLLVADIAPVPYAGSFALYATAMRRLPLAPKPTRAAADAFLTDTIADPAIRAFLLQNLDFAADPPRWRIGLDEIIAALPDILAWPSFSARYDGPTLFLAGARSDYIQPHHHPTIQALFPAARLATLPDAGHWLHVDNPGGFLASARAFLASAL